MANIYTNTISLSTDISCAVLNYINLVIFGLKENQPSYFPEREKLKITFDIDRGTKPSKSTTLITNVIH